MNEKTFMIAVDLRDERLDLTTLKQFIRNNPDFTAWWNHIPSLYLVQSRLSADDISKQVERHAGGARFLAMEVNPSNSQGWMPEQSWEWIKKREQAAENSRRRID